MKSVSSKVAVSIGDQPQGTGHPPFKNSDWFQELTKTHCAPGGMWLPETFSELMPRPLSPLLRV